MLTQWGGIINVEQKAWSVAYLNASASPPFPEKAMRNVPKNTSRIRCDSAYARYKIRITTSIPFSGLSILLLTSFLPSRVSFFWRSIFVPWFLPSCRSCVHFLLDKHSQCRISIARNGIRSLWKHTINRTSSPSPQIPITVPDPPTFRSQTHHHQINNGSSSPQRIILTSFALENRRALVT